MRQDLLKEFASASGQANVTESSFLDLTSHWESIVRSLFAHNEDGLQQVIDIHSICVIGLSWDGSDTTSTHGVVEGNMQARRKLIVLNTGSFHFDPCLPL